MPRDWLYPFSFDKPERRTGPWSSEVIAVHQWAQWDSGPAHVSALGPKAKVAKRVGRLRRRINVRAKLRRVRSQLLAVKNSIRFRPNSLTTGPESAITVNRSGNPISFPTNDLNIVAHLLTNGFYDPNFHAFLRRTLHGSDTYVDVGANIGQFVITASQCLSHYGRVFAFEPNPEVFKHLEANVYMCRMRGMISCEVETSMFAMGTVAESAALRVPLNHPGRGSITHSALTDLRESEIKRVDVQVETLSERLGALSHIRLLKIDVEGAELSVLQGAHQIIESQLVDYIDLEFLPQHLGSDTQPLLDWIQSWVERGARLHSISRRGRLSPVNFQQMRANPPSLSHLVIQMPRVARDNQEFPRVS